MASIPLPALDVKPVQQPDLLQKYAQLQQLKGLQQEQQQRAALAPLQQQAAQQNIQQGGLQIQQQQQALKDQQAMTQAMQQWDGKDMNELAPLVLKNGGSANAVMGLKQKQLEMKQTYSKIAADDATTGSKQIETLKQKNDMVSGAMATVLQAPDDQLPQALVTTAQQLQQQGLLDPQHVQMAQQIAQAGDPSQIRNQLTLMRKGMMSDSQLLDEAKANASIENEKLLRQQEAQRLQETQNYHQQEITSRRQGLSIEAARLAFDKQRQGTQDQQAIEAQAQQIANGDLKLPPQGRSNPLNAAIRARAFEINPNLSDELYTTKQDFLSSKGKANAQVQSLNKLSAHLGELQQASDAAGFSPLGITGAGKSLRLAEQLFGKEDVKFLSGVGVGTEGELNALIDKTHSPIQSVRNDAIQTLSKFTSDAARQLGDQYERGTKLKFDPNQHFTPDTVNMLNSHGGTSARPQQGAQPGATHRYNPQTGQIEAIQ